MKYIRNFNSLNLAKTATLYSPTLAEIKQDGETILLAKDLGSKDAEMQINTDASGNISIGEKPQKITITILQGKDSDARFTGGGEYNIGDTVTCTAKRYGDPNVYFSSDYEGNNALLEPSVTTCTYSFIATEDRTIYAQGCTGSN